ncbi:MAG: N-acetyl-gamma-glutamyl-phosphate reductase [Myxococcaceae bacterium]|nr:N-acetyl-gamma-glutamyl-phosphate reductase [Myxococcaceae bacterium]
MQTLKVGIIGASGYTGIELARLLARHGGVALQFLTSDRWVGEAASARLNLDSPLKFVPVEQGVALAGSCDAVFLATPAESALQLVPRLLEAGTKVIDLSGAFRLKDASLYPGFYGLTHDAPLWLAKAVYGLPELFRAAIPKAQLIANPGCYPTAVALALAPLLRAKLAEPTSLVVSAASGVSGAGRKATEDFSFMELDGDFRAYKTLKHQHTPEIAQTLSMVGGVPASLVFTPHLLPVKRGILATAVATLKSGVSAAEVTAAYAEAYRDEPLVTVVNGADAVRLAQAVGTPRAIVGVTVEGNHAVAISAIDNLLKGAASQAVQNFNLLFGVRETQGVFG